MSNNIEWVDAKYAARTTYSVLPEDFQDPDSAYFDESGTATADTLGIRIESGGHTTLVIGTVLDLQAWAVEVLGEIYYTARKIEETS